MIAADELACARATVESGFQDEVTIPTLAKTRNGRGETVTQEVDTDPILGNLQRMKQGQEAVYASRLQGRAGYRLKVPHTVPSTQTGDVIVNGDRYEIMAGFGGEARSLHTRLDLVRYS